MPLTFLNNQYTSTPALSPAERGFRFGDGVFETIAVYHGRPYQWAWHMGRLIRGLAVLEIPYDTGALPEICRTLIDKNQFTEGVLRIYISRGQGSKGYMPDPFPNAEPTVVVETLPFGRKPASPATLWLSSYEKISPKALPVQCKTAQGLQSTLVRIEAAKYGCCDGLMLTAAGHITETASANIFWFKDGTLYTPSLACGVLEGSTRAAILRFSPWPVREVAAEIEALQDADAVFITNIQLGALPVAALLPLNYQWNSERVAAEINRLREEEIANPRRMPGAA